MSSWFRVGRRLQEPFDGIDVDTLEPCRVVPAGLVVLPEPGAGIWTIASTPRSRGGEAVDTGDVALQDAQPLVRGQQAPGAFGGAGGGEDLGSVREQLGGAQAEFLGEHDLRGEDAPRATASRMAAALTIAPVRWMPTAIASLADRPASRASLIRVSRKTP
jgi:hypothetical protein